MSTTTRTLLFEFLIVVLMVGAVITMAESRPVSRCTSHEFRRTADSSYFEVRCPRGLKPTLPQ